MTVAQNVFKYSLFCTVGTIKYQHHAYDKNSLPITHHVDMSQHMYRYLLHSMMNSYRSLTQLYTYSHMAMHKHRVLYILQALHLETLAEFSVNLA